MIYKKNLLVILSFIILIFILFFVLNKKDDNYFSFSVFSKQEKIKIAACPTCFELVKSINTDKYEIIRTESTAESVSLLKNQEVDMILAGRTLKSNEYKADSLLIEEGYSFLKNQEAIILIDQLKDYTVYTDLNIEKIKNSFSLSKIEQVKDVYDYIDKGVVITSWENTDYSRAEIVHILERNGERVKLSRQPTIYCPNVCGKEASELALLINNK